jgi:hypothetical protein
MYLLWILVDVAAIFLFGSPIPAGTVGSLERVVAFTASSDVQLP